MSKRILLVGGGGHCKSVLDSLLETRKYTEIGIIDKEEHFDNKILGINIIGCDDDLPRFYREGFSQAFVTVGSIGDPKLRIKLFNVLETIGFDIPNIIDKTAIVSANSRLEKGIYIGKNAVINAGTVIQRGAIINTSVVIEHDCAVGEFSHVAPGSVLCGQVRIGAETHIGATSVIKQQVHIGSKTIIGMGSVVLRDIGHNVMAYGNPCKEAQSK